LALITLGVFVFTEQGVAMVSSVQAIDWLLTISMIEMSAG
jgi:hypothetical protein